jgi:hypothetical protein
MIHSKYRRNVWFRPFLDSNLGAAFFFFSSVSMQRFPQLFQAVLVYFRQSVAFFNKPAFACSMSYW